MFKKIIAGILALFFIIGSCVYTYSDRDIPFRERALVIQDANGEEMYLTDMCKTYYKYKNSLTDINAKWRQEGVTVTGTIKVEKVKMEKGDYKVISKDGYCQAGQGQLTKELLYSTILNNCNSTNCVRKIVVIYFNGDTSGIKELTKGDKLSFKANFNTLNDVYLILTEGEIV